jgi:hypothetical protein
VVTSVSSSWRGLPRHASWILGAKVEGAQDGFWRRRCFAWLYMAAKPSHVGVDMDRLACPLHRSTVWGHQIRGQSFLSSAALSHRAIVGGGAFPKGVKPLAVDI